MVRAIHRPDVLPECQPRTVAFVEPPGYDHWNSDDPQLRRSDMGSGDRSIETHIALDAANISDGWQTALTVNFADGSQVWLGPNNQGEIQAIHSGTNFYSDGLASAPASLPPTLRIDKRGGQYGFECKPDGGEWTSLDAGCSQASPIASVGLIERTLNWSAGDSIFDVDSFRLERFGPAAPAPYTEAERDEFDGSSLSSAWTWHALKSGPAYSLTDLPDSLRISLPPRDTFEHWLWSDEAPELRRTDLGDKDWNIEAQLGVVT